jgi:hypothetical protein
MVFNHTLAGPLSFQTSLAVNGAYLYADEATDGTVIQPSRWKNTLELKCPKFVYAISDAVTLEAYIKTVATFDNFKLFNTSSDPAYAGNTFGAFFKFAYSI